MAAARNRSTYITDWVDPFTGEVHRLNIRHTRDYLGQGQDHIEIVTPKGVARQSHPLSATGYLSHFLDALELVNAGGPVTFVDAWITRALASKEWRQAETKRAQGDLFNWADTQAAITKRKPASPSKLPKVAPNSAIAKVTKPAPIKARKPAAKPGKAKTRRRGRS